MAAVDGWEEVGVEKIWVGLKTKKKWPRKKPLGDFSPSPTDVIDFSIEIYYGWVESIGYLQPVIRDFFE
jgi:hypothetical protein